MLKYIIFSEKLPRCNHTEDVYLICVYVCVHVDYDQFTLGHNHRDLFLHCLLSLYTVMVLPDVFALANIEPLNFRNVLVQTSRDGCFDVATFTKHGVC